MSNFNNNHIQLQREIINNQPTKRREIINFSSTNWTDKLGPSLNLASSSWTTAGGLTATFAAYSGSNSHTYTITLSNGDIRYLTEVSGQETYTHTYHETDGGPIVQYAEFVEPTTLFFRDPNFNYIYFNSTVRAFVDNDEFQIQIDNGAGTFTKRFIVK